MKELLFLVKGLKKQYFLSLALILVSSLSRILIPFLVLRIFDDAISNNNIQSLMFNTMLMVCATIISSCSEVAYQYIVSRFNRKLVLSLRARCYSHVENMSGSYLTDYNSGDLFTILYRDIEEIPSILTSSFFGFISNFITVVGLIFFLITLQFDLLIILIVFQIILYLVQNRFSNKIENATKHTRASIGALNSSAQEILGHLFAFTEGGLKVFFKKKHEVLEKDYADKYIYGSYVLTLNHSVLNLINSITVASILLYGGYKVIIGALTYGGLVSFNLYSQRFMGPMTQLVDFKNDLASCSIAWSRLKELLDTKDEVISGISKVAIQGNISFKNVSFSYNDKAAILKNISLDFKRGKIHALVGPSGVGKTTLIHLLYRLWDVQQGEITIDGENIKSFDIDCLRNQISIVSQNIFLLNDSIYNNIVLDNDVDPDELNEILHKADIYNFIDSLPNKLETIAGENGIKLSGGEKQRISIARALLKKSPILIFDEATSMLDNETEDKIISILLNSFENITIILIAHRLSTVKSADVLYVLNQGEVIETGNHEELLNTMGFYYSLYNIKRANY